jgi:hypothetical protein
MASAVVDNNLRIGAVSGNARLRAWRRAINSQSGRVKYARPARVAAAETSGSFG